MRSLKSKLNSTRYTAKHESQLKEKPGLPVLDFYKINRLRINHNTSGTGANLREHLVAQGGASTFFRTKRLNMIINKPLSMFDSTHLQTSGKAQEIADPEETQMKLVKDLDT